MTSKIKGRFAMRQSAIAVVRWAAIGLMFVGRLSGAQQTGAMGRLEAATAQSSLGEVNAKPWHLKMGLTVYDAKGQNPQSGNVEVWQSGSDRRALYTFGSATFATLLHEGKHYGLSNGGQVPSLAEDLVAEVLHPGPEPYELDGTNAELRKAKFGKVELDCIMLNRPSPGTAAVPLGLFPTYCLNPKDDEIRSSYNFGSRTVIINGLGRFLDHEVSLKLDILEGQTLIGKAEEESLSSYTPDADEFTPSAEMMRKLEVTARVSGGVIAGIRLTSVQPVYPAVAKENHESGTVVLRALIGRDGHVHSLRPVSVTNSDFVISAVAAVRQWTYKPYILNGEPVEVDTTITVNFQLTH